MIVIGTHSRAWSLAWISTPGLEPSRLLPIRSARIVYGPRGTSPGGRARALDVEEVRQRDRSGRRLHDAGPDVGPVRVRPVDQALRAGLDRRGDLRRGRAERARGVLGQQHADGLAVTSTASGRSAPGRLTNSTVMSLPPSWPHAAELSTTAAWPVPPIVAWALR